MSQRREAPRLALELHRQRGVPVARRSGAGAVQRRPAPAVDPDAVHQSRSRAADAGRHRHDRLDAGRRRAGVEHPRDQRPEPSVRAAGRRRGVAWRAISHLSLNYLSLVQSTPRRGPPRCAICSSSTRRAPTSSAQAADRGHPVGAASGAWCGGCAAPGPLAFGRGLEITVHDRRAGVRGRQRLPARVGARSRISPVTCRSTRSPKPCCDPRAAGRSTDGCHNGARGRRSSVLRGAGATRRTATISTRRCGGWSACTTASRAGDARCVPVDEPVRLGQDPDLSFAPAPLASFEVRDGRAAAAAGAAVRPVRPQRAAADAHHRIRARAAAHAGDPTLSRFLDIFHHRFLALFYRAWAQAQPHVNRDRPKEDRFAVYIGAFLGHGAGGASRSRRAARPGEVLSRRRADPAGAERRRAGAHPPAFFRVPVQIEEFVGHWMSSGTSERTYLRRGRSDARRRRRARRPGLGPAAQVPDSSRAADARAVRELPARRHAAQEAGRLGPACICASSSIGMCACS